MGDPLKRWVMIGVVALAIVGGGLIGLAAAGERDGDPRPPRRSPLASPTATPAPTRTPTPAPTRQPDPDARPDAQSRPRRRIPRRRRSPAPMTGRLVPPAVALRHPIAVMIDDLGPARPQSGFNSAAVVWQAPAEGGIPRYMMIFQDQVPVGRRARPQRALLLHRLGGRVAGGLRPRRRVAAGAPDAS